MEEITEVEVEEITEVKVEEITVVEVEEITVVEITVVEVEEITVVGETMKEAVAVAKVTVKVVGAEAAVMIMVVAVEDVTATMKEAMMIMVRRTTMVLNVVQAEEEVDVMIDLVLTLRHALDGIYLLLLMCWMILTSVCWREIPTCA